jgi:4-hydroxybenzoate polyprenyltransferase
MSRARAWLEIVRISNAPTVVSNAIAGAVLGTIARIVEDDGGLGGVFAGGIPYRAGDDAPSSTAVLAALIAPLLAYLGGMVLNDAFDSAVDARERPARPIPSGRIARSLAFAAGFALLAGAMLASTLLAPMALAATVLLCGAIVVYDRFHTKSVASTMLLALCRALASLIPMLAMSDGDIEMLARRGALALPLALAAWTLGLSIVARSEAKAIQASDDRPRLLGCIRCGQLMPSEAGTCPECGSGSDHAARMARLDRRRQPTSILRGIVPMAGTLAILAALLVALTTVMHHGGRSRHDPLEKLPPLGVAIAIVCIALSSRALIAMRRDPHATPAAVGTWIACLALVDAMALGIAGAWLASAACVGLAGWTLLLQRRIAGS